jgi:hypothetical protein
LCDPWCDLTNAPAPDFGFPGACAKLLSSPVFKAKTALRFTEIQTGVGVTPQFWGIKNGAFVDYKESSLPRKTLRRVAAIKPNPLL